MNLSGNTILITGGTSGIGLALAKALQKRGNEIIISGRREHLLQHIASTNDGIEGRRLDISDASDIHRFATSLIADRSGLNVVIHNAGMMKDENLLDAHSGAIADETVITNLLGPMRLNAALLPHLRLASHAVIAIVTSGLAFVPRTTSPAYAATKAALHSWVQSLRMQTKSAGIEVIELIPPYVATELQGGKQKADPRAMPLDHYVEETMSILEQNPTPTEVLVQRVQALRFAERDGRFNEIFEEMNAAGR
jgi:uncharacterized oxidoreductase